MEFNKDNRFDLRLRQGEDAEGRFAAVLLAGREESTVEVKTEPKYEVTGNVALEFKQSDGLGGEKPSGIDSRSTESEWWTIEYLPNRFLTMRTSELRELARLEYENQKRRDPRYEGTRMGDNGNVGVLVPLASLIGEA